MFDGDHSVEIVIYFFLFLAKFYPHSCCLSLNNIPRVSRKYLVLPTHTSLNSITKNVFQVFVYVCYFSYKILVLI